MDTGRRPAGTYPGSVSAAAWWSPRLWGAHAVGIVAVGAATGLGLWQFDAWQERRAHEARDLTSATPRVLTEVMGPDDPFPGLELGRPVEATGTWVPDGTVFISGREHEGTEGYWVVTPLAVDGGEGAAVPVVRGWTADPAEAPAPPAGPVDLVGWLQPPEGTGAVDDDPADDVLPQLRIADVIQHVDQDLYGAYLVDRDAEPGLETASLDQLPKVSATTALRNFLYAVEWWLFGAFAAFVWWRYVRDVTSMEVPEETDETADENASVPSAP